MTAAPGPAAGPSGLPVRNRDLKPRIASALVLAIVARGAAWAGGPLFDLLWLAAGVVVLWEWAGLVGIARGSATLWTGGLALVAAALLAGVGQPAAGLAALMLGATVAAATSHSSRRLYAGGGVLYAGALVAAAPLLRRSEPFGLAAVLWLFAVVWGTDTMAFFGGRLIGGPKLAPRLSPSKTWSGLVVGAVSGACLGLLVAPRAGNVLWVLGVGLLGGAIAQGGDLFESALKRRFGAKDAGSIIPGHGGVMDRLDGFIATSVFAALLGLCRFGPAAAGTGLFRW